jgi:hypothetical protein
MKPTITEEDYKGCIHALLGGVLSAILAYNLMKLSTTRKPRHALNVGIYGPLVFFEAYQTWWHWHGEGHE